MNRWGLLAIALTIIAAGSAIMLMLIPAPKTPLQVAGSIPPPASTPQATSTPPMPGIPDIINVTSPSDGQTIGSPLVVKGTARGSWYFEASFPIALTDWDGKIIVQAPAQAQSDWMTQEFVPFKATVIFPAQPSGSRGYLILKKDNPSGDPAYDQSIEIPVVLP